MKHREHTLDQGEAHPSIEVAKQLINHRLDDRIEAEIQRRMEAGDRPAQIAHSTCVRLKKGRFAADRYVTGFAIYLLTEFPDV